MLIFLISSPSLTFNIFLYFHLNIHDPSSMQDMSYTNLHSTCIWPTCHESLVTQWLEYPKGVVEGHTVGLIPIRDSACAVIAEIMIDF